MSQVSQDLPEFFSPPVRAWFQQTFDQPTPPQAQGWPAIQRGEHTLILAPTGMGKTLTAFLWGIDALYQELTAQPERQVPPGVRVVYISPLKALNNDIRRNLRLPLAGIRQAAQSLDLPFPDMRVLVRSGDTPASERQAMLRRPPHILITTPESLYLLLTSPKAREIFQWTRTVIVDEIHTLVGTKRGVHLAVSLERLNRLTEMPLQRIGLSATIHPLEEAARFLGGQTYDPNLQAPTPRPVTMINAQVRKALDLRVVMPIEDFRNLPGDSLWPTLIPKLLDQIQSHRTTLIFCNSRRQAERTANRLNEQLAAEATGQPSALLEDGFATGTGFMASGTGSYPAIIRAHHGSMAREARLEMERDLKEGRLPALVATSSLELGIDIGSVDLVMQLQSPKSVAQGLQRVGRSGHLVGETSKGRIYPTHRQDVIEAAAVAGGMLRGEVEPTYTPRNPLDVLAQQLVAMVSVESWDVDELHRLICQTYAYEHLTPESFRNVLEMLAGRYPSEAHRELRARLAWDRVNNRLAALPGSRLLALTNPGVITNRGSFAAYRGENRVKLGELDEEFIYETRVGDAFMLGSQVWRVTEISDDRILVNEAPGATPRMPFWRGEFPWRPYELGQRIGQFRHEVAGRLQALTGPWQSFREIKDYRDHTAVRQVIDWLGRDYTVDENSAWQIIDHIAEQLDTIGTVSSDRAIVVEIFEDEVGEPRLIVHSPFGGRVNGPWGLALVHRLREQSGVEVEVQSNDDGILLRFPGADGEFPLDLVATLGPTEARERLLRELPDSAVFGARFRQNAARALLLPGNRPGKRTPFWLQRLKAKDLMQVVRRFEDFPILIETYRDCLEDVMDLPNLEEVLRGIEAGQIEVRTMQPTVPSPVALGLMRQFIDIYMYQWDTPKAERQLQELLVNRDLLQDVLKDVALGDLLKPEAIDEVTRYLQHTTITSQARSAEELAVILEQMGDLSTGEIVARTVVDPSSWLQALTGSERVHLIPLPTAQGQEERWLSAYHLAEYRAAFALASSDHDPDAARQAILTRFLSHAGPVSFDDIRRRYAFPIEWLQQALAQRIEAGELAHGHFTAQATVGQFLDRRNLEQIHRRTLGILRREVQPVPRTVYADFLAAWQHLDPTRRLSGEGGLIEVLQQLRAAPVVGPVWERDVLPLRLTDFRPADLAALCQRGELVWIGSGGIDPRRSRVRFIFRGEGNFYLEPASELPADLSDEARQVYELLKSEGALFVGDMQAVIDLSEAKLQAALIELFLHSLVTNDNLETLRQILQVEPPVEKKSPRLQSSFEAQLAERRQSQGSSLPRAGLRRPSRSAYDAAKRRVQDRLGQGGSMSSAEPSVQGRWSLVQRLGVMGRAASDEERVARQTRQLLQRWGVVTREVLTAEESGWSWSPLYQYLHLLEMRGEIRRGYFVQGLPGPQFALPEVVEQLRERRDRVLDEAESLVVMNGCDPANLYGPGLEDGPIAATGQPLTFSRLPSTWLVQQRGQPGLLIEGNGHTLTTTQGVHEGVLRQALRAWLDHFSRSDNRLTVHTWNEQPILESDGQPLLESLGFRRDYPTMAWERRF